MGHEAFTSSTFHVVHLQGPWVLNIGVNNSRRRGKVTLPTGRGMALSHSQAGLSAAGLLNHSLLC